MPFALLVFQRMLHQFQVGLNNGALSSVARIIGGSCVLKRSLKAIAHCHLLSVPLLAFLNLPRRAARWVSRKRAMTVYRMAACRHSDYAQGVKRRRIRIVDDMHSESVAMPHTDT